MNINTKKANKKKAILISIAILLAIAILVCALLYLQSSAKKATSTESQATTNSTNSNATTESSTTETKTGGGTAGQNDSSTTVNVDASVTPSAPTGTFVSNHHPNLSGSPAPSVVSSTCTTTPGAQCKLSFTKGTTVLSLDAKTTDSNGNASWEWNVNTLGLTVGDWTVTATAINGAKTTTATDPMKLSVSE